MAAASCSNSMRSRASGGPVKGFQRSISPPPDWFCSSSSSAFASSSSSFSSSRSTTTSTGFVVNRSASPTRINFYKSVSSSSPRSVRFSIDRSPSPSSRSIAVSPREQVVKKQISNPLSTPRSSSSSSSSRRTCMCSPTTHPGSFRCSLHKGVVVDSQHSNAGSSYSSSSSSNRGLDARRSAMTNSLVRIGTVEGEWVKRALAALIRPSSHHQRRRAAFQPRPSRLSIMSKAAEDDL